uniref:Putative secreted protein n=1 Tax=Anopheles marajoara TaxID=58244 RepID=A0A2M4CAY5_9DIPT
MVGLWLLLLSSARTLDGPLLVDLLLFNQSIRYPFGLRTTHHGIGFTIIIRPPAGDVLHLEERRFLLPKCHLGCYYRFTMRRFT